MKIEVGKTYTSNYGHVVTIVAMDPTDNVFPFEGSDGRWYTSNGRYYSHGEASEFDLIDDGSDNEPPSIASSLMKFDPVDGAEKPYPSEANQYREYHGQVAWLYNPYTGEKRDPRDIGSDVFGLAISNNM